MGTRWVWELELSHAREIVEVTGAWWNGEEWWVRTRTLHTRHAPLLSRDPEFAINTLGRFFEAATQVGPNRGRWIRYTTDRPTAWSTEGNQL